MEKEGTTLEKGKSPFMFCIVILACAFLIILGPAYCDEINDYESTIRALEKAHNLAPDDEIITKNLAVAYNNYALSLFEKDRYDLSLTNFKQALTLDPENTTVRDNMYNITLKEAQTSFDKGRLQEALTLAKDCIEYDSGKPNAYIFLGNAYYQQNNIKEATSYWDKALKLDPDIAGLKESVQKAKRELEIEQNFKTRARAYFNISFEGKRDSGLVWDVIDMLEDARRKIKSDFGFFTDKEISVIIYNTEQFKQATQKLDWTFGLYDGKIRLRVGDISPAQEETKTVIYHEYAHAILHTLYPNNIPIWLHEGFAGLAQPQANEASALGQEKVMLKDFIKKQGRFDLDKITELLGSSDYNQMSMGYIASKLFLKYLIDKYGIYKFKNLLAKLNSRVSLQGAAYDIYRLHIEDIENDFAKTMP